MFAIVVNVSNARNTVAVLQSKTKAAIKPFEVQNTAEGFATLTGELNALDGEARDLMGHNGMYYESFAMSMHPPRFFVSVIHLLIIKIYQGGVSVRKVKTYKADAVKITRFTLVNWEILPQ